MPPAQDSVNPTISQDRVPGVSAKEESQFRLLEGGLKAWNSGDDSISRPFHRTRFGPSGRQSLPESSAFMLGTDGIELSNKLSKRARSISGGSEGRNSYSESSAREQAKASVTQPDRKRRKRCTSYQSQSSDGLDKGEASTLHRIFCNCFERPRKLLFQDQPSTRKSRHFEQHLEGRRPVGDLGHYIERHNNPSFLVFHDYNCQQESFSPGSTFREIVRVTSDKLYSTIERLSRFMPTVNDGPFYLWDTDPRSYHQAFLFHHRSALEVMASPERHDISSLLKYLNEHLEAQYVEAGNLFAKGMVNDRTVNALFCPNEVIVIVTEAVETAYILRDSPKQTKRPSELKLECWGWAFDGVNLRRKDREIILTRPTHSAMPITKLQVYPMRYASEKPKRRILSRGRKFWDFRKQSFVSYQGWDLNTQRYFVSIPSDISSFPTPAKPQSSRFMIDYLTYRKFHSDAGSFSFSDYTKRSFDTWPETIHYDQSLSDIEAMLLPPVIHGFFMKEKKWISLLVENVGQIEWNKDAYERLVLPKSTKDLVKALVMVRKSKSCAKLGMSLAGKRDDIIAGKGSGLIMLLHGGPGTGKTLTAERCVTGSNLGECLCLTFNSVAELAEMPLYSVTCGDVGTKPDVVEQYMNTVLHLGKTWNCVLLLDEADVFLEERTLSDVERNSLVSVFLRVLEYYEGILILTSNRVGTLDEAFKSRIQVALQYPPLNRPSRKQIWWNFFDMLETDDEEVNLHELRRRIDDLTSHEMNGRQIRNVLTTARQVAMYNEETLGWTHLEQAIKTASAFDTYLKNVHGHTDEQWASDNKLR